MENGQKIKCPGIYNISESDYHKDPCPFPSLSRSTIKDLLFRSPAHAWFNHPRLNPNLKEEENGKFDLGSAAHAFLLEGKNIVSVIDADDWRTKIAKEERDRARVEGKIPLLSHQFEIVKKIALSAEIQIVACPEFQIKKDFREDGDSELSYIWQEEEIWLKIRPDWISKDRKLILDYKTTDASANPHDLARHIVGMGYDIQAALYIRGVKTLEHIEPQFIFVFQETSEPYLCSFIGLPPDFMEIGKSKVEYGIFLWKECMTLNKWPGYPNQVAYVDTPPWAMAAWDQRAMEISEVNP